MSVPLGRLAVRVTPWTRPPGGDIPRSFAVGSWAELVSARGSDAEPLDGVGVLAVANYVHQGGESTTWTGERFACTYRDSGVWENLFTRGRFLTVSRSALLSFDASPEALTKYDLSGLRGDSAPVFEPTAILRSQTPNDPRYRPTRADLGRVQATLAEAVQYTSGTITPSG